MNFEALLDTPVARFYKYLDKKYPNSKFIFSVREIDGWLKSCEKFFYPGRFDSKPELMQLHRDLYNATEYDREKFENAYNAHMSEVFSYFKGRENDLLVIDVCAGEGWNELCGFLKKPVPKDVFPWK